MTSHEKISQSAEYTEVPVSKRYSFASPDLLRLDVLSGHGGHQRRFIEYPSPNEAHLAIRESLISKKLLLGEYESTIEFFDKFKVPNGSKPILHGAIVRTMGDYTYNDMNLFTDLGKLLRDFGGSLGEDNYVEFVGNIGLNVALVDYTQQKERGLFLVPGSELYAAFSTKDKNAILDTYLEKLHNEFGIRFNGIEQSFIDGFQSAER